MANLPNNTTSDPNSAQTFFNGYFTQTIQVSQAVYGQVLSFFRDRTSSDSAAESLTQALLTLCTNNQLDPLLMTAELNKAPNESELKKLLISFFNASKGATSKLGYANQRNKNDYVTRTILQ
jgi:hypothetical protein